MAKTIQPIPPTPDGEKKVVSPKLDNKKQPKSVSMAEYRRLRQKATKATRKTTNMISPKMPPSPNIITGNGPFSIGADQMVIAPTR